jgi:putative phosphoesterase
VIIGVISDTHGLLRPEAVELLRGSEHIIHAGDIGSPEIIPELRKIAPVTAIRGNVDTQAWARAFSETEVVELAGMDIYIIHDAKRTRSES